MAQRTALMALVFMLMAQALASAESSFSTPAGAQSSSKGFSTPAGAETNGPFVSPSGFSTPAGSANSMAVGGEVINIEGDTYVVRDAQGRNLRVQPGKDARNSLTSMSPPPNQKLTPSISTATNRRSVLP